MSGSLQEPEALARREAATPVGELSEEAQHRLLLVRACDEWFALPVEAVREVQPLERVCRVPSAPPEVLGILNLRGRPLTLYWLGTWLQIREGTGPQTHFVVLDLGDAELRVALAVQEVGQVRTVPVSAVGPAPPREGEEGQLAGLFELDGVVVGVLDPRRLFGKLQEDRTVGSEPRRQ